MTCSFRCIIMQTSPHTPRTLWNVASVWVVCIDVVLCIHYIAAYVRCSCVFLLLCFSVYLLVVDFVSACLSSWPLTFRCGSWRGPETILKNADVIKLGPLSFPRETVISSCFYLSFTFRISFFGLFYCFSVPVPNVSSFFIHYLSESTHTFRTFPFNFNDFLKSCPVCYKCEMVQGV